MSEWSDRFENSPVWGHLKTIGANIDGARARDDLSPEAIDGLERLRVVLTFIGKRLAACDPLLVDAAQLLALANAAGALSEHLGKFSATNESAMLSNAHGHADTALHHLRNIDSPVLHAELEGLGTAASKYREALRANLDAAKARGDAHAAEMALLTARLGEVTAELNAAKASAATMVSDFQAQFSQAQAQRATAHDEAQAVRQDRFDKALDQLKADAQAAQTAQKSSADELIASHSEILSERDAAFEKEEQQRQVEHTAALKDLTENYQTSAKRILHEIEDQRAEVEKLAGMIGNTGVTSGYTGAANYARRSAFFWQGLTVVSMLGLVWIGVKVFNTAHGGDFNVSEFGARVFVAVTVGVLAAYSAAQADKHMESERRNRKLALELAAIGPYLSPLPDEEQNAFRITLGQRTFGQEDTAQQKRSPANGLDLLKSKETRDLVEVLAKLIRSDKP